MGLSDRDYMGTSSPRSLEAPASAGNKRLAARPPARVTRGLVILNVLVFVLCANPATGFVYQQLLEQGRALAASPAEFQAWVELIRARMAAPSGLLGPEVAGNIAFWGVGHARLTFADGQWWRLLSAAFLHANALHIFFNMFVLWSFGPGLEQRLGAARFLVFYLLCALGGSLCSELMAFLPAFRALWEMPGVGASGAIYGVLFGLARLAPGVQVQTMFGGSLSLRAYCVLMALIGLFTVAGRGQNFGGELAHLGGGVVGLILAQFPRLLGWIPGAGVFAGQDSGAGLVDLGRSRGRVTAAEIDQILDKASQRGFDQLTEKERAALRQFRSQH